MPRVPDAVSYVGRNVSDCGYCASPDASVRAGAVAHGLSTQSYGELLDARRRRSATSLSQPAIAPSLPPPHPLHVSVAAFQPSPPQLQLLRPLDP